MNIAIKSAVVNEYVVKGRIIEGYASTFGNVDSYGDTIVKGAFLDTIAKATPKMLFQHNHYSVPIGKFTSIHEDSKGLFVSAELTKGLSTSDDIAIALEAGTIDGLSIGGYLSDGDYSDDGGGRIIRRWTDLVEISLVNFPADSHARINNIRSLESLADIEGFLRESTGISRNDAKALISRIKSAGSAPDSAIDIDAVTAFIVRANTLSARR